MDKFKNISQDDLNFFILNGYYSFKEFNEWPPGQIACLSDFFVTVGICRIDRASVITRFCFDNNSLAQQSLDEWDGNGYPPGWWIKQKPEEVFNPRHSDVKRLMGKELIVDIDGDGSIMEAPDFKAEKRHCKYKWEE